MWLCPRAKIESPILFVKCFESPMHYVPIRRQHKLNRLFFQEKHRWLKQRCLPHLRLLLDSLDLLVQLLDVFLQVGTELVHVGVPLCHRFLDGALHGGHGGTQGGEDRKVLWRRGHRIHLNQLVHLAHDLLLFLQHRDLDGGGREGRTADETRGEASVNGWLNKWTNLPQSWQRW